MKGSWSFITLLIIPIVVGQCKSYVPQGSLLRNDSILWTPTLIIDSCIVEHQYEGNESETLKRIELTGNIQAVPQWSFAITPSLEEVLLSSDIKTIGDNAFFSCKKLTKINLSHIESFGENCFKLSNLEEVDLSSAIKVGEFAFANCPNLRKVEFSNDLDDIGDFAFWGDSALCGCSIPAGKIGACAFMGCVNLEWLLLGQVESIGDASFLGCVSLKSVVVPASVKVIGREAFLGCKSLKEVTINGSETQIANDAFEKDVIINYVENEE